MIHKALATVNFFFTWSGFGGSGKNLANIGHDTKFKISDPVKTMPLAWKTKNWLSSWGC